MYHRVPIQEAVCCLHLTSSLCDQLDLSMPPHDEALVEHGLLLNLTQNWALC